MPRITKLYAEMRNVCGETRNARILQEGENTKLTMGIYIRGTHSVEWQKRVRRASDFIASYASRVRKYDKHKSQQVYIIKYMFYMKNVLIYTFLAHVTKHRGKLECKNREKKYNSM